VKAANTILDMGPTYLVVKKGEHGALLFSKDRVFFAPAMPLEDIIDPTGAGDTFAGGFIGYLARSADHSFNNLKRAIIVGSALGLVSAARNSACSACWRSSARTSTTAYSSSWTSSTSISSWCKAEPCGGAKGRLSPA
jgi:sugar/nucleoside kinase (ribokinase family)